MNIRSLFARATARGIIRHKGFRPGFKDDNGLTLQHVKDSISVALKERDAEIQKLVQKATDEAAAAGKVSEETKTALNASVAKANELFEKLSGLEQEIATLKSGNLQRQQGEKSIGTQFAESEDFKSLVQKGRGTALMRLKTINSITTTGGAGGTGAAGGAVPPDRLPGIIGPALRQLTIRDLILPGRTSSNLIQYVQETGFQNMAGMVAEGAAKPQSDLTFTLKDSAVKTLAHWVRASNQILADVPQLETYINTRLTYGLKFFEETQLLAGDGTGNNLLGLIPQATDFDESLRKAGDTKIDTLRRAILQVRIAEYRASGIVLNPIDWADIELTKDDQGRYIWVNVAIGGAPQLWRLPVVDTNAMPSGDFMVGAFNMAAQVFDREDSNVQVSTEDADNFTKNMVTIRAEERLALVVFRPESFVYGPFTPAS